MDVRKEVLKKILRPPCFGNTVKCPVLFTERMYKCEHYEDCERKTIENWEKEFEIQTKGAAKELLEEILAHTDELIAVHIMKKYSLSPEEYTEMRKLLYKKLREAVK